MASSAIPASPTFVDLRPRQNALVRLGRVARKKPIGAVAAVICIILVVVAVAADAIAPYGVNEQRFPRLLSPGGSHLMGTDNLFRDIFSRIVVGSRISLGIGFTAVFFGTIFGTILGLISGYVGRWADMIISRVIDVVLGFPPLVAAIFFVSVLAPNREYGLRSFMVVSLAIALIITPTTARIVRGSVLTIRNLQYIEAAVSIGNPSWRIMFRHILPNVVAPIIVIASIQIGNAILAEAALSFLSLGIADAEHPSWGTMLQDTRLVWQQAWWTAVMPGLAISIAVLSFNLFGDALRDVLDPRLRGTS